MATIQGEEITTAEFSLIKNKTKSEVITYFRQTYKSDIDTGFWERAYSGEIPNEILKQKAMDKMKKLKIEQKLAKDKGFIEDISYDAFLDAWSHENRTRQKSIESGKVVYGNSHFDEWDYYTYRQSNLVLALKKKLAEDELKPNDEKIEAYYARNKDNLYSLGTNMGYRELAEVQQDVVMQLVKESYDSFLEEMIQKSKESKS
jgi:hypothetical protein